MKLQREIKILKQRLQRRDIKIKSVNELINLLREENCSSQQIEDVLKKKFEMVGKELMDNQLKNHNKAPSHRRYSPEVRNIFCTVKVNLVNLIVSIFKLKFINFIPFRLRSFH